MIKESKRNDVAISMFDHYQITESHETVSFLNVLKAYLKFLRHGPKAWDRKEDTCAE
jgi:hypothetical protein